MNVVSFLPKKYQNNLKLNYKKIVTIGNLNSQSVFANLQSLHLSFNLIVSLKGLEQFPHLISLSLNNNLIEKVDEFNVVTKQLEFCNMQFNPFIKTDYGYYEYFLNNFKKLKRLNGEAIKIINGCDQLSRWYIHFIYLIAQQYDLAVLIVQKKDITLQIENKFNQPNHLFKQLNLALIEQSYHLISILCVEKEFTQKGLEITITKLNKVFMQNIPDCQLLNYQQAEAFKRVFYESFNLLINHQNSNNNHSFIDYLITQSKPGEEYFTTFQRIAVPQSHVHEDFFEIKEEQIKSLQKRELIVPNYLSVGGLHLNLIQHEKPNKTHQHLIQYFPVYPYRLDYMQSMMFVLNDKLMQFKRVLEELSYSKVYSSQTLQNNIYQPLKEVNQNIKSKYLDENDQDLNKQQKQIIFLEQDMKHKSIQQNQNVNAVQDKNQEIILFNQLGNQPSVQAKRILLKSYVQLIIKSIQAIQDRNKRNSFHQILLKSRPKQISQVQKLFLMKKVFDILRPSFKKINKVNTYYNNQLLTLSYICLFNHKNNQKELRKKLQDCMKMIKNKQCYSLIYGFMKLKDLNNQFITLRRLNNVTSSRNINDSSQNQEQQQLQPQQKQSIATKINKQNKRPDNSIKRDVFPQMDLDKTPKKFGNNPRIVYFYDQMNKKTCRVCNFDL